VCGGRGRELASGAFGQHCHGARHHPGQQDRVHRRRRCGGRLRRGTSGSELAADPILTADAEAIKRIRLEASGTEDLLVVDFTDAAQTPRDYREYLENISGVPTEDLKYLGVALYGSKKPVNKLTGGLSLLRSGPRWGSGRVADCTALLSDSSGTRSRPLLLYSPECVEGEFCEVRLDGVLGSWPEGVAPSLRRAASAWSGSKTAPPPRPG